MYSSDLSNYLLEGVFVYVCVFVCMCVCVCVLFMNFIVDISFSRKALLLEIKDICRHYVLSFLAGDDYVVQNLNNDVRGVSRIIIATTSSVRQRT